MSEPMPLNELSTQPQHPESPSDPGLTHDRSTPRSTAETDDTIDREVQFAEYIKILFKRRWTAVAAFLLVFVSVAAYTFTTTPIYQAKVQILIEKENSNVVTFKDVFDRNQIADDYYQTQYKILQSRTLARRVADDLNLWNHPRFSPAQRAVTSRFSVTQFVKTPVAWVVRSFKATKPVDPRAPDETEGQSVVIDRVLGNLTVTPVQKSRLVDVKYDLPDARLAADIANATAKAYIDQSLDYKFSASKEASNWLGQQLTEQRKQVEASEVAMQRYRERSDSLSLEERQNIVVQKLGDLNAAVTRAKTERIQKEAAYNQMSAIVNDRGALDTVPQILSNTFIQQQKTELAELQSQQAQLAEKLGDRHPDMVKLRLAIQTVDAKIQGEIAKGVQSVRHEYEAALQQERSLMTALEQQKRDALALNRKGIDYGVLQRDAATNRQIFESLLQRAKETGISGELRTSNIRIVDSAEVPRRPASPNIRMNMLAGAAGGLLLAIGLVSLFEYLDNRISRPEEIKADLGLPFLGIVPALFDQPQNPLMNNGVPPSFVEAFRSLRTNVLFSSTEEGGQSLVVTSTAPGEGKTIVASNLAVALSQVGLRVLLMDADMRKPRVHIVFNQPQSPGLSNVLVGNAKASEAVLESGIPGLWLLTAGQHPPNPSELLGSKRHREFMAKLQKHFDWIVIDTPPVMAVTDAAVAAHAANGVVFVVGAQMTSRHAAQRALEQLEQGRAKLLGGILNRVDLDHHAYYYSQYYRSDYGKYYTSAPGAAS